jgi:hypothetical protein
VRWAAPVIRAGGQADATEESGEPRESREKQRGWSWRTPGPVLQGLIAFVIYLVGMIIGLAQPLLPHLNVPHVQQAQVDANFYIWAIRWWPYALTHGLNPLFTTNITQPNGVSGYSLAWATTTPTLSLLLWPVTAAVGPIAAFNLSLILAPPASAWATFILARRLTGKFWPALLAGPVFGFCAYEISHEASGQPNLTVTVLIPLICYIALRWWDGSLGRRAFLIWMTLALTAEFYTFVEAFTDLTMLAVIALVIGYFVAARDVRPRVVRLAVDSAIAYAGAIVLAAPYLYEALRDRPKSFHTPEPQFWVDLAGVVVPRFNRLLGMKWLAPSAGHDLTPTIYVGVPLLLLFVLVGVFHWSNRLVRLLVPLYVVIFLLSLGQSLVVDSKTVVSLPWGKIWSLPILSSAEPQRLLDFGQLVLALVMAVWLAQVTKSWLVGAARWALAMLSLFAIFANVPTLASVVTPPKPSHQKWVQALPSLPVTNDIPAFFTQGIYQKYVKPGERVVIISHRGNAGMMFQAYTGFYFNIAGGFINASLSNEDALPDQVSNLSHLPGKIGHERVAAFRSWVKREHIGAIIVERAWSEHWMYNFDANGINLPATTVGGVTIFQVPQNYASR